MYQARTSTEARQGYRISLGFKSLMWVLREPMQADRPASALERVFYAMAASTSSATGPPDAGFCPVISRPSAMANGAHGVPAF